MVENLNTLGLDADSSDGAQKSGSDKNGMILVTISQQNEPGTNKKMTQYRVFYFMLSKFQKRCSNKVTCLIPPKKYTPNKLKISITAIGRYVSFGTSNLKRYVLYKASYSPLNSKSQLSAAASQQPQACRQAQQRQGWADRG